MIYSVSIFKGQTLVHHEGFAQGAALDGDSKQLLVGMILAVCGIVSMLGSGNESSSKFEVLTTPEYRIDYYETPSGYRFVVMSSPMAGLSRVEIRAEFERLYKLLFVPLVVRNPFFKPDKLSGDLRESHCEIFVDELRNHFKVLNRDPVGVGNMVRTEAPGVIF